MMAPQKQPTRLKEPTAAPATSDLAAMTPEELGAACMQAQVILPQMLHEIAEAVEDFTDQVAVLALYARRKGEAEGLFKPEDFDGADDDKA
jgi:hypothetical protein